MYHGTFQNLSGVREFELFTDHKPLGTLGKVHTQTFNRLLLATIDFDFEIPYKKGSEIPAYNLSRDHDALQIREYSITIEQEADHFYYVL